MSFVMAMIIPARTKITMRIWHQTQNGDMSRG
jgi:hypothetical protein